jgi:transcriptional regulator with XRE-family HTH domain
MRRTRGERELPAFAQALREWMEAKGISSTDLARALGVSAMAISRWRNGIDMPASGNWPALAEVLGVRQGDIARLVLGMDLGQTAPEGLPPDVQALADRLTSISESRRRQLVARIDSLLAEGECKPSSALATVAQLVG